VGEHIESVVIRSYPKAVFLYPSFLVAVIAAILATVLKKAGPDDTVVYSSLPGNIFMIVFSLNLLVFAWDFSKTGFITVILIFVIGILGAALLETKVDVLGGIAHFFEKIQLRAHPHFYLGFAAVFGFVLVLAFVQSRIDYWEVHGNELLHITGFVGNVERFPAPNLRFRKELPDVFEYALLRSGTLVLEPVQGERHPLPNVINVGGVERRIEEMLSTIDVTVEAPKPAPRDMPTPP
jgi:hypothetical protein